MRPFQSNNFNFIRFALAMMVLLSHSPELIDGDRHREIFTVLFRGNFSFGEIAVGGFFMLSGYLITKSWQDQPVPRKFLEKRVRRIFPAFILSSLICVMIVGPLGAQSISQYFSALDPVQFVVNALTLGLPVVPPVFVGQPYPVVNGAMWTIRVEFTCYLAVLLVGMSVGFRRIFCLALAAMIFGICVFEYFVHTLTWFDPLHVNLASYFAAGSCCYVFRDRIRYTPKIAVVAAAVLFCGLFSFRIHQLAFLLAGTYLLFFFAFAKIPLLANFGKLPDVSYGLYLYGWPIQKLIIWWFPGSSPWAVFFAAAVAAVVAGWISWHVIEKRFIQSKRNTVVSPAQVPAPLPMHD